MNHELENSGACWLQVISAPDLAPSQATQAAALAPNDMRVFVGKQKASKQATASAAAPADSLTTLQVNRKYGGDSLGWLSLSFSNGFDSSFPPIFVVHKLIHKQLVMSVQL